MRTQLIQYLDLLFAGSKDSEDIHQEILQNTLDRYDDLILEGKTPEAAYRLAILGIGDIRSCPGSASHHRREEGHGCQKWRYPHQKITSRHRCWNVHPLPRSFVDSGWGIGQ